MTSSKLQASLQEGHHHTLHQLTGEWAGETKTWFEDTDPVDVSPMSGTIKPVFDGRFVMHEYKGTFQGQAFEGIAFYGYHIKTQRFQSAWMDTFHMGTGIMFSEGKTGGPFYKVDGAYQATADNPEQWGWRTEIQIIGADEIVITAYNITPAGEETKATETVYKKVFK